MIALEAAEEKSLVVEEGSSNRAAVLVGDLQSLGSAHQIVCERVGVERRVDVVIEKRAVKIVGPRLEGGVDDPTACATVLCIKGGANNFEFLHCILIGRHEPTACPPVSLIGNRG